MDDSAADGSSQGAPAVLPVMPVAPNAARPSEGSSSPPGSAATSGPPAGNARSSIAVTAPPVAQPPLHVPLIKYPSSTSTAPCIGGCGRTHCKYKIPDDLLEGGTVNEGVLCRTCWTFVMRCAQRDGQSHKRCTHGPCPTHETRLRRFELPDGVSFIFLLGDHTTGVGVRAGVIKPYDKQTHKAAMMAAARAAAAGIAQVSATSVTTAASRPASAAAAAPAAAASSANSAPASVPTSVAPTQATAQATAQAPAQAPASDSSKGPAPQAPADDASAAPKKRKRSATDSETIGGKASSAGAAAAGAGDQAGAAAQPSTAKRARAASSSESGKGEGLLWLLRVANYNNNGEQGGAKGQTAAQGEQPAQGATPNANANANANGDAAVADAHRPLKKRASVANRHHQTRAAGSSEDGAAGAQAGQAGQGQGVWSAPGAATSDAASGDAAGSLAPVPVAADAPPAAGASAAGAANGPANGAADDSGSFAGNHAGDARKAVDALETASIEAVAAPSDTNAVDMERVEAALAARSPARPTQGASTATAAAAATQPATAVSAVDPVPGGGATAATSIAAAAPTAHVADTSAALGVAPTLAAPPADVTAPTVADGSQPAGQQRTSVQQVPLLAHGVPPPPATSASVTIPVPVGHQGQDGAMGGVALGNVAVPAYSVSLGNSYGHTTPTVTHVPVGHTTQVPVVVPLATVQSHGSSVTTPVSWAMAPSSSAATTGAVQTANVQVAGAPSAGTSGVEVQTQLWPSNA